MDNEIEQIVQALLNGESISELLKDFKPKSRTETYLKSALMKTKIEDLPNPQTRLDVLLMLLNDTIHKEYGTKFDEGYSEGHDAGLDVGRAEGYDDGYSEGNAAGYQTGHTEGYNSGHDVGYSEGTEAGKKAQEKAFWDRYMTYLANGTANYAFAGNGWRKENFRPNRDMAPIQASGMFYSFCGNAGYNLNVVFDLQQHLDDLGVKLDFSKCSLLSSTFNWAGFTRIGVIDCSSASSLSSTFANSMIGQIDKLIVHENLTYNSTFLNLSKTTHMIVEGVIGKNGFNIQWMVNLDHESLMSIINSLKDYSADTSGTVWKIVIGETNRAKLTDAELLIAENKGWIVE